MPAYTRGRKRDQLRYVKVNPVLWYGFKTVDLSAIAGVSAADLTALGHTANPTGTGALLCIGANAPKPPRVTKKIAGASSTSQGSTSTFCAYDRLPQAAAAGWSVGKSGREVGLRTSGRSVTALVEIAPGGVMYAFSMNAGDFASYGAELGLKSASSITTEAEINRVVFGSSLPRPGRASKELTTGTITSFYDPSKKADLQQPSAGWRIQSAAKLAGATTPTVPE